MMIISEKRHAKLYKAISDPIMDLRIKNNAGFTIEKMDKKLFDLEIEIHKQIVKALDLHRPVTKGNDDG